MTYPVDSRETNSAVAAPAHDPRVVQALEAYLASLEAGQAPDRQQFLAQHADIADELALCLRGLEFVQQAAPHLSGEEATAHQANQISIRTPWPACWAIFA